MGEIEDIIKDVSRYYKAKGFIEKVNYIEHNLVYDSPSEALEPLYFWIHDFMGKRGFDLDKIIDNFASSPGSGHFSELGGKKSAMQEQSSRILGTINNILRSVLNLIYDLKEFKIRLSHYEAANSSDSGKKLAGILALKQIWMDKVDIQRGQGSINALSSGNLQFVTLRDAFLAVKSADDVDNIDLNDRVKRLLKPRVQEFYEWKKRSELELEKRFEIEKAYLKSQVNALKLQSRWARPYLKAAQRLEQTEKLAADAAVVTAFNTVLLQLVLMGKSSVNVIKKTWDQRFDGRGLPEEFAKLQEKKKIRKYYEVVFVDFRFTGIPNKVGQHYVFGGKADIKFKSYGLNEEELELLKYKLEEEDVENSLRLVEGMTTDSIEALKLDIDEFLKDKEEKPESPDTNPFSALFSVFKSAKKEKDSESKDEKENKWRKKMKELSKKGVKKDSYAEAYVRNLAIANAMDNGFKIYDTLKKAYGMATFPYGGEFGTAKQVARPPRSAADRMLGFR